MCERVRANLDLDVRGACVRRKKRSQLTPCSFSTVHMWLSSHDFGDRREKNYQPHEDHERLRDFKSYCFVGFVYISALGLSVFKVQCELVGKG